MCMIHIAMHKLCKQYRNISTRASRVLWFWPSFVLFQDSTTLHWTVNMSLLASNKLTKQLWHTESDPFVCRFHPELSCCCLLCLFRSLQLMLDPTSSFLGLSSRVLDLLWLWSFEYVQIIGKEAWNNREHVLFSHACSVSQTGHTDR